MPPVHPGEVLAEEHLEPLGATQHRLAVVIGVRPRRINEIVHGERGSSADIALRLARFFGTSERFGLDLQSRYDLEREKDNLADTLRRIQPLTAWTRCGAARARAGTGAGIRTTSPRLTRRSCRR